MDLYGQEFIYCIWVRNKFKLPVSLWPTLTRLLWQKEKRSKMIKRNTQVFTQYMRTRKRSFICRAICYRNLLKTFFFHMSEYRDCVKSRGYWRSTAAYKISYRLLFSLRARSRDGILPSDGSLFGHSRLFHHQKPLMKNVLKLLSVHINFKIWQRLVFIIKGLD